MKRENIILGLSALAPFLLRGESGGANKSKPIKLKEFKKEIPYCSTDKFYLFEDQIVKKDANDKITYYFRKPSAKFKKLIEALTFEDASIEPLNTEEAYAWHRLKPRTDYMKKARHWSVYFDKDFGPILMGTDGNRVVVESGINLSRYVDGSKIVSISQKLPAVGGYIKETKDRVDLFLPSLGKAISVKRDNNLNGVALDRGQPELLPSHILSLKQILSVWKPVDQHVDCTLKRIKGSYEVEKVDRRTKKRTTKIESSEKVELTTDGQTIEFNSKFIPKFKDIESLYTKIPSNKFGDLSAEPFLFITEYSMELIMPMRIGALGKGKDKIKEQVIDEKTFRSIHANRKKNTGFGSLSDEEMAQLSPILYDIETAFNNRMNKRETANMLLDQGYTLEEFQKALDEAYGDGRAEHIIELCIGNIGKGSKNDGITVIRVEKRRSRFGDKHHMRSMSRGRLFTPGEVVGATITLEGTDPQALRTYHHVESILREEERKLGLFGSMLVLRNVYQSHKKPNMWEAQWDIS